MCFQFSCKSSDDEEYLKEKEKAMLESVLGEDLDKYTNGIIYRSFKNAFQCCLRSARYVYEFVWVCSTSLQAQPSAAFAGRRGQLQARSIYLCTCI